MRALLIIDMQLGSFRPYSLRHDTMGVVDRINKLSAQFRSKGDKIIFIQHDGTKENAFLPGTDDWQILPELDIRSTDIVVSKIANDAFYKSDLAAVLAQHDIAELYITGCATDFCVDSTIKSALTKEYQVTVVSDAHTTASRPHIDAPTVINHYNWLWADMTPTLHELQVIPSSQLLNG